jgi:hypothetical protein
MFCHWIAFFSFGLRIADCGLRFSLFLFCRFRSVYFRTLLYTNVPFIDVEIQSHVSPTKSRP